jgi:hypothetical protein
LGDRKHGPKGSSSEGGELPGAEQAGQDPRLLAAMHRRKIQRKAQREAEAKAAIPAGGGAPLDAALQKRMQPQLGADLSGVKVHTGAESAKAAEDLGARAFAVDGAVHFGHGEYAPGTKEGDRLIAHELTHVVQGQRSGVQAKSEDAVSKPSDPAEMEADGVADHVADRLHGGAASHGAPRAAAQPAPVIAAKLDQTIMRSPKWDPDKDEDEEEKKRGEKGKTFRGGGKGQRDNWYGFDDPDFQAWWHREGKAAAGGQDLENREQAEAAYNQWVGLGKPKVK